MASNLRGRFGGDWKMVATAWNGGLMLTLILIPAIAMLLALGGVFATMVQNHNHR